jgi:hypothetical protein
VNFGLCLGLAFRFFPGPYLLRPLVSRLIGEPLPNDAGQRAIRAHNVIRWKRAKGEMCVRNGHKP